MSSKLSSVSLPVSPNLSHCPPLLNSTSLFLLVLSSDRLLPTFSWASLSHPDVQSQRRVWLTLFESHVNSLAWVIEYPIHPWSSHPTSVGRRAGTGPSCIRWNENNHSHFGLTWSWAGVILWVRKSQACGESGVRYKHIRAFNEITLKGTDMEEGTADKKHLLQHFFGKGHTWSNFDIEIPHWDSHTKSQRRKNNFPLATLGCLWT